MNLKPCVEILIPENRVRKDFDGMYILDLQKSIEEKGLMQPIVLRNDHVTLVAGEQRLKALTELHRKGVQFKCDGVLVPRDAIPYVTLAELAPLKLLEAEYEENAVRRDLSWQERCDALAKLHGLRSVQAASAGKVPAAPFLCPTIQMCLGVSPQDQI